ncbi:helix-hairpin-helix domain-containing protein [Beggiatoa alba]|nr:helix-hairpin-helix domain-containing protein [Beggiatoa alba]
MKKPFQIFSFIVLFLISSFAFSGQVNINTADAKTIAKHLKGVGFRKAQAIVLYRKKHGTFKTIESLSKVKGIGFKTVEKNRANISVVMGEKK